MLLLPALHHHTESRFHDHHSFVVILAHSSFTLVAAMDTAQMQQDGKETFYPSHTQQRKSNKMPASKSKAPNSVFTVMRTSAIEAWLDPFPQTLPNLTSDSVAQPVANAPTCTAPSPPVGTAAALPPQPVRPPPSSRPKAPPPVPPMPMFSKVRQVLDWWNNRCQKDEHTKRWIIPATQDMLHAIGWMPWSNMVKDDRLRRGEHAIIRIMPTFYVDEADHNRDGKPRLDLVIEFNDGEAVRYHPDANPISLPASADNEAMRQRRNYLTNIRRKSGGQDWYP